MESHLEGFPPFIGAEEVDAQHHAGDHLHLEGLEAARRGAEPQEVRVEERELRAEEVPLGGVRGGNRADDGVPVELRRKRRRRRRRRGCGGGSGGLDAASGEESGGGGGGGEGRGSLAAGRCVPVAAAASGVCNRDDR